jgi:hypothetical protein
MDAPTKEDMERDPELDIAAFENRKHFYPYPVLFLWLRRAAFAEGEIVLLRKRLKEREDFWQQRAEDTEARVKELEARVKELEGRVYGPGRFGV